MVLRKYGIFFLLVLLCTNSSEIKVAAAAGKGSTNELINDIETMIGYYLEKLLMIVVEIEENPDEMEKNILSYSEEFTCCIEKAFNKSIETPPLIRKRETTLAKLSELFKKRVRTLFPNARALIKSVNNGINKQLNRLWKVSKNVLTAAGWFRENENSLPFNSIFT